MVNTNPGFELGTVAGIERAKKNGWELGSEELVEMTHGLSRIFPRLSEDSVIKTITSAFVAKVLMGGYKDTSELGIATGERIGILIHQGSIAASCDELGIDPEVQKNGLGFTSKETVPNLENISLAALAYFANKKVRGDLMDLGLDREVIDKYTR